MQPKSKLYLEIEQLVVKMIILNTIVFFISLIWGFKLSILFGLLVGLVFSCLNMVYLGYTVSNSVQKSTKKAKNYLMVNYILRYLVFIILLAISVNVKFISTIGVTLPLFYPKVIYFVDTFRREGK